MKQFRIRFIGTNNFNDFTSETMLKAKQSFILIHYFDNRKLNSIDPIEFAEKCNQVMPYLQGKKL
jgi:hypothetical protein